MGSDVWILGGTGRSGRAIAAELLSMGVSPVLVGRDPARLEEAAARAGHGRTVVAGSVDSMAAEIRRQRPAVVINTIGPFTATAVPIAEACLPGSDYIDLANDVAAVLATLGLNGAAADGRPYRGDWRRVRRDGQRERRRQAVPGAARARAGPGGHDPVA